jgi:branched-chain amino acid transport system permease protein
MLLAGCASDIDAGQARSCRSIIPALNPAAASIAVLRTIPLGSGSGVRVDYRVLVPAGPSRERFVECRFAGGGYVAADRGTLIGVTTDAGPMGALRLQLLKRFWLAKVGPAADPQPVEGVLSAPELPWAMAVGLQHVLLALPAIAIYGLLAAAYSLIYGLVGRINLAFGELAAVGGYAAFLGFAAVGAAGSIAWPLLLALVWALAAALSYGLVAARLVIAPLMPQSRQRVLVGTIALAMVLQEYLRLTQGSKLLWLQPMLNAPQAVARAGGFVVTMTPMALWAGGMSLLAAGLLVWLMQMSRFGRAWRACADDAGAAELMGVDPRAVLLRTFALASATAGLAGYVLTIYYGSVGFVGGIVLGLKALLAAVVGGIGSVPGAFLGGLLLGSAEQAWSALFPLDYRDVAIFSGLVVLLVLRPNGLFGFAEPLPRSP